MSGDLVLVTLLLTDDAVRKIFAAVAKNREVLFKDLLLTIPDRAVVRTSLEKLKAANLINEADQAPVGDFGRYYVTADGLRAERQLQRMSALV